MSQELEYTEFTDKYGNFLKVGKEQYVMPETWKIHGNALYNFNIKSDDIFIMTMPRSGTTVTTEMIWLLSNNLDYETAKKIRLEERVYVLEKSIYADKPYKSKVAIRSENDPTVFTSVDCDVNKYSYEICNDISGQRIIKTHLPFSLFKNMKKSGAKVIYVARNPKDRLVSAWRFIRSVDQQYSNIDIKQFWEKVKTKTALTEPYWSHVQEAWSFKNDPNVLFLFYEDVRANTHNTIKKVANFLGKSYTDEEIDGLADHLNIDNFRNNKMVNTLSRHPTADKCFIGQGKIGGYKDVIPDYIIKEIDEWIQENNKHCNIKFPYL